MVLVAACCVVPQDFPQLFLPDKLWVLTLNHGMVKPQFFNYLLKNGRYRDVVRSLASGGHDSMLNISMKKFMTLDVPCPPIDIQNQFAAIVEKVESIKSRYQQSLTDLESLYGALSQKAFKGELDLSRVILPTEETNPQVDKRHKTKVAEVPAKAEDVENALSF
jgi:type I restriction enzyme S subunit